MMDGLDLVLLVMLGRVVLRAVLRVVSRATHLVCDPRTNEHCAQADSSRAPERPRGRAKAAGTTVRLRSPQRKV